MLSATFGRIPWENITGDDRRIDKHTWTKTKGLPTVGTKERLHSERNSRMYKDLTTALDRVVNKSACFREFRKKTWSAVPIKIVFWETYILVFDNRRAFICKCTRCDGQDMSYLVTGQSHPSLRTFPSSWEFKEVPGDGDQSDLLTHEQFVGNNRDEEVDIRERAAKMGISKSTGVPSSVWFVCGWWLVFAFFEKL